MPTLGGNAFFIVLTLLGGASVGLQQVLNANLRGILGSPWWATFVSYLVGLVCALVAALGVEGGFTLSSLPDRSNWFTWTGGMFGAIFITAVIISVPRLGVATTLALVVVGQLLGSLVFDHFGLFGLQPQPITVLRLAGVACLCLGVVLIKG